MSILETFRDAWNATVDRYALRANKAPKPARGQGAFDWDESQHPRQAKNAPGGHGGEFRPILSGVQTGLVMPAKTNEEAHAGDQLGLFGEAAKPKREGTATIGLKPGEATKGKQQALFDTDGNPNQMDLFGDGVMPEDLIAKESREKPAEDTGPIPFRDRRAFADKLATAGKSHQEIVDAMQARGVASVDARRHAAMALGDKALSGLPSKPVHQPSATSPEQATEVYEAAIDSDKSVREAAEAATRKLDEDYQFARASTVGNAGEDLKGSARHKVNEWRGLADAEKRGSAAEMMTRANLQKIEPHNLMATVDAKGALSHLAAHYALGAFPAEPGEYPLGYSSYRTRDGQPVGSATAPERLREQYFSAYKAIKETAEKAAKSESDPRKALEKIRSTIKEQINICRGLDRNASGMIEVAGAKDPYNPVANGLATMHNRVLGTGRKKTDIMSSVMAFTAAYRKKHDSEEISTSTLDRMAEYAKDVMDGKSLNKIFDLEAKKRAGSGISPADMYVATATRKGGRDLQDVTSDPNKATKHLVENFGLRGVQWGNSVTDDERKHHAARTVEALTDLADVTGLHPKDIAINGKLGFAIGARGKGNASAHYEPSTQVINITRKNGAGTIAHEWGHAFDHMLVGHKVDKSGGQYMSEESQWEPRKNSPMGRAYAQLHKSVDAYKVRLRSALRQAMREGIVSQAKANDYWNSGREIFARSFERYVAHKLGSDGQENTYLAGFADNLGNPTFAALWPTKEESAAMAPAFDAIFAAYRKEKHGSDEVVKFSQREAVAAFGGFYRPFFERVVY